MKLVAALVIGTLLPTSAAFAASGCIDELSGLLDGLAARHGEPEIRRRAKGARESVAAVCGRAADAFLAAERIVAQLEDPAVRVMGAAHFQRTLEEWMGKPVVGVGLTEVLSLDVDEQTGRLTIIAPVPGSPAAEAGLRAGDVVATIGGEPAGSLGLTRSMERLRVTAGERVDLGILRGDRVRTLTLEAVRLPALEAVSVERVVLGERHVLHVRLRQFVPGAAEELRSAVESAPGVDAIVLDLRDNPGGLVDELQQSAGLFLAPGTSIARIAGPEPAVLTVADDAEPLETPLRVIIGAGSASAAEGLAGALQVHGRARVYGERSFGKGLVHQTVPLADGAMLMFPSGELETPAGRPILRHGIDPDVRTANPLTAIGSDLNKSLIRSTAER